MEIARADQIFDQTNEPRAHLNGLDIPENFALPPLAAVRADAKRSLEMRKNPSTYEDIQFIFPPNNPHSATANRQPLPMHLKLALIFNAQLPNLFTFGYFARPDDVSEDLLDDCIWALSHLIRIMEECTEAVLRAFGHMGKENDYNTSKYLTLLNARTKILRHLLRVERFHEALPYAKAMADEECMLGDEVRLQCPTSFGIYGEVLVLTRADDAEAATMLRRAMLGVEAIKGERNALPYLISTRAFLARALRNIGAEDEAATHEKWLITWFRKNPHLMVERKLRHLLLPAGPVLEGLGGESWLKNRKGTAHHALEVQYIYYCSKECQKSNWKHHKVECREMAATQEKIEHMRLTDPSGVARAADWRLWCNKAGHGASQFGLIHPLGLHRNPAHRRTHIVFKQVEYVPMARKLRHKFCVLACGVFRVTDVLRDIEAIMGLDPGEGFEYVESLFSEPAGVHARVSFIDLSYGMEYR
ncbi:hypothetical protein B0H14DRAFT_3501601 [Mycena olivaceomarginata]|nr:hypothetical protein B0H14DRAFT_3501601 [Mycena olivaceomarginata]